MRFAPGKKHLSDTSLFESTTRWRSQFLDNFLFRVLIASWTQKPPSLVVPFLALHSRLGEHFTIRRGGGGGIGGDGPLAWAMTSFFLLLPTSSPSGWWREKRERERSQQHRIRRRRRRPFLLLLLLPRRLNDRRRPRGGWSVGPIRLKFVKHYWNCRKKSKCFCNTMLQIHIQCVFERFSIKRNFKSSNVFPDSFFLLPPSLLDRNRPLLLLLLLLFLPSPSNP